MNLYYLSILTGLLLFIEIFANRQQLTYDPEKGIISINKNRDNNKDPITKRNLNTGQFDIHSSRQKDPPEIYFRSGLEYYKNGDYKNALKNFIFADSSDSKPHYTLWIGKTWRKLKNPQKSYQTMKMIVDKMPQSDVADDALFEIAIYFQENNHYEKAYQVYSQLIEQYPFGLSFSTGKELREIARNKRNEMRNQIINILATLGYAEKNLPTSYRIFQKEYGMEITGIGDSTTISAIKEEYKKYIQKENRRIKNNQLAKEHISLAVIAGSTGLINLLLLFFLKSRIKNKIQHLSELNSILNDLDTKKI
ncbi:MAG: tetratricopeptide repeat protein [Fibrobacter sp.]|nr:tetratricopeptide repeat protein [Fibrobacter sp.]